MAFREMGNEGETNSTTAVTMVAAPRKAGVKRVIPRGGVGIFNDDDAAVIAILMVNKNGTKKRCWAESLAVDRGNTVQTPTIVLDATDESLEIVLKAAVSSDQAEWTVAYAEIDTTE
jgi:hypothetical protein